LQALGPYIDAVSANAVWLLLFSVLSLIVGSFLGAWFVARLPADYFCAHKRQRLARDHLAIRLVLFVLKNIVGMLLMFAGLVMLFTPGQGLLTLLAGLMLTDFPGKYALERRLARRRGVMKALNWLRAKRGEAPFITPP